MKHTSRFKKVMLMTLIGIMLVHIVPAPVLAQALPEIHVPGLLMQESRSASSASAVLGATTSLGFSVNRALESLVDEEEIIASAKFQGTTIIRKLYKKHFGMKEKVSFVVDNPRNDESIDTVLKDSAGKKVAAKIEKIKKNNSLIINILPPQSFTPGKFTIEVEDTTTGQKIEQDFTWGVLAVNTNKSSYTPGETADLAFAVLDEKGKMVCDADLELKIKNQALNKEDILSTKTGEIKVNPECQLKDVTENPDYEASYVIGEAGIYNMDLSATTKNGTFELTDTFTVVESLPFDIERQTATRIYPPHVYPVEIKITAHENFEGTIVETVPESFDVIPSTASATTTHERVTVGSASLTPSSNVLGTSTSLVLPYEGKHAVTQLFGEDVVDELMREKYTKYGVIGHDGIDFDLPVGTPVLTADDGEVVLAQEKSDYGATIVVKHAWGQSYYGHLSAIDVEKGQKVKKGEKIGESGSSGLSSDPHLHFGIKLTDNNSKNGYYGKVDPAPLLGVTDVSDVLGASTRSGESVKMISWEVRLSKGDTITLGYSYKAPFVSPQFYTLGPLRLYKNNAFAYGESRKWQIAVDDTASYTITDGSSSATTTSGACDTSLTNSTVADGAQGTVIFSRCVGRTDTPVVKWNKTLTWETMGIPAGSTITQVDGSFKYRVAQESHTATQAMGTMQLRDSSDAADCAAAVLESSFDPGAVNAAYTTRNATGNVNVSAGCQASSTSVTIRLNMSPVTGNNAAATSELRADDISLSITYTPPAPDLQQIHYRWRNDDGNEANATFRRAEDTAMSRAKSVVMRLRLEVSNEGSATATSTTYRLEYGTLATTCSAIGSWTAVPTSPTTEHFDIEPDASGITDGSATSDVTTGGGLTNENTTFVAGQFKDTGNTTSGISLTTSQFTELEFALQANTNAVNGTTYCFRVTNAGSTTNFTYPQYAQWTVGEPTMTQNHYKWRNDDGGEASLTGQTITLHPTGQGNYTAWTSTGCTENTAEWDCVNDNNTGSGAAGANDGITTSLATTTGSARSSFSLDNGLVPPTATITQLEVFMVGAEVSAAGGDATVTAFYRFNSADTDCAGGASAFGGATFTTQSCVFSGLSLTSTNLDGLEIGILFGANDPSISKVYVTVTYNTTGATWKQGEDTEHTGQSAEENIRLRVEIANTGGVAAVRRLQVAYAERTGVSCGDETFIAVPTAAGSEFQMTDSTYFANEEATTTQLTATGSFTAGDMLDTANQPASGFSIANGNYTEMEYNFLINASAADKTWCFKLTDNGTDLDSYSLYPVLSVVQSGPTLEQLLRHGAWYNGTEQPFTF